MAAVIRQSRWGVPLDMATVTDQWKKEGYGNIAVYHDSGNTNWNVCERDVSTVFTVAEGNARIQYGNNTMSLRAGDEIVVPSGTKFTAISEDGEGGTWYYGTPIIAPEAVKLSGLMRMIYVTVTEVVDIAQIFEKHSTLNLSVTVGFQTRTTTCPRNLRNAPAPTALAFSVHPNTELQIKVCLYQGKDVNPLAEGVQVVGPQLEHMLSRRSACNLWVPLIHARHPISRAKLSLKSIFSGSIPEPQEHHSFQRVDYENNKSHFTQKADDDTIPLPRKNSPSKTLYHHVKTLEDVKDSLQAELTKIAVTGRGRPSMGIEIGSKPIGNGRVEIVVLNVDPSGAAYKAGVKVEDVLTHWNSIPLVSDEQLQSLVQCNVESSVTLSINRGTHHFEAILDMAHSGTRNIPQARPEGSKLGIKVSSIADDHHGTKLIIVELDPKGSACQAGLNLNDEITHCNGVPVFGDNQLISLLHQHSGELVTFDITRDSVQLKVDVLIPGYISASPMASPVRH